jgi:hypothetical protein
MLAFRAFWLQSVIRALRTERERHRLTVSGFSLERGVGLRYFVAALLALVLSHSIPV